jgi:hypothetical protein
MKIADVRKPGSMVSGRLVIICLACMALLSGLSASELVVIYPRPQSDSDTRDNDVIEVLTTALQKTVDSDGPFILRPSKLPMTPARYRYEIKGGKYVNVIWATVSEEMEEELLPVRIPVRKGILGYRIFLIRKQDQEKFAAITTVEELKRLKVGQGLGWNDVAVFEQNGFDVEIGNSYEGLFHMLVKERFDYFSRGINEAAAEYEQRKEKLPDLFFEQHLLLYYPWPKYFFVSKDNPQLAERIKRGLMMMLHDGTFDQIFLKHHGETIEKANLKQRRLFRITNPLLPSEVPLRRKELWFNPFE